MRGTPRRLLPVAVFVFSCFVFTPFMLEPNVRYLLFPHDASREAQIVFYKDYTVIRNYLDTPELPSEHSDSVTLVLHSTIEYIDEYLEKQIATWEGPISVSVFARDLVDLEKCFEFFNRRNFQADLLKVSIFYETNTTPNYTSVYPINVARNIARREIETKLFLSGDIENVLCCDYNRRIREMAKQMLVRERRKTVIVHRRFESRENCSFPTSKSELVTLFTTGDAVPFHKFYYAAGHHIPGLDEWLNRPEATDVTVFNELPYNSAHWEPQFVAANDVPFHDERFPFRRRSNTHLAAHLCRLGYTFTVVNDLFSVHRGFKLEESATESFAKSTNKSDYLSVVRSFRRELDLLYPKTKHQCPKFLP